MPRLQYREKKIGRERLARIADANEILAEYSAQGYDLTLRQLYYQFVARDIIPNNQRSYKRLGDIIDDGRMCGLIDWNMIEDRTRNMQRLSRWTRPEDMLSSAAASFHLDRWANQATRVEVWCEKEALIGIFERICDRFDVPYFACRGYVSQSEMWRAAQRMRGYRAEGKRAVILHFGDHDPSGIDMTRDIEDRMRLFEASVTVKRLALNMDQVDEHNPPPNPAKLTDSRCAGYVDRFGDSSWELDALKPDVLNTLVKEQIDSLRDMALWQDVVTREKDIRARLMTVESEWDEISLSIDDEHFDAMRNHLKDLDDRSSYRRELDY